MSAEPQERIAQDFQPVFDGQPDERLVQPLHVIARPQLVERHDLIHVAAHPQQPRLGERPNTAMGVSCDVAGNDRPAAQRSLEFSTIETCVPGRIVLSSGSERWSHCAVG